MPRFLSKFLFIVKDNKRQLIILILIFLFSSSLDVIGIGLVGPFIGFAVNPNLILDSSSMAFIYKSSGLGTTKQFVIALGLIVIAIFIGKSILSYYIQTYIYRFSLKQQGDLRSELMHSYLSAPYTFFLTRNSAEFIQQIVNETSTFCNSVMIPFLQGVASFAVLCLLLGMLAITDFFATITITIFLLITFGFYFRIRYKFSFWGKEASKAQKESIQIINHALGGLKETKIIGCESYFEHQLKEQIDRYTIWSTAYQSVKVVPRLLIEVLIVTFLIGFTSIYIALNQGTDALTSILGVFTVASIRIIPAANQLSSSYASLRNASYPLNKLYQDLKNLESWVVQDKQPQDFAKEYNLSEVDSTIDSKASGLSYRKQIELDGVSYSYPNSSQPAVNHISLKIDKGQSIAFIGKSGAGKTTLADIILGLLTPQEGDIRVDNQSIYQSLREWQNMIGYIPQSIFLIDDTLEKNIAYGVPEHLIDSEQLYKAIKVAQLNELVEQLPKGVKTVVGERGVLLSGGQRQRIGIARAIYHEREILVLDEATSALDNETESHVSESINALSGAKTLIVIAHRLTTIKNCDHIYMMDKGSIIKSGMYQEVVLDEKSH